MYFDGVSEWDHDSDWKSLWYSDDEDRDADDDEADEVLDVRVIPRQLVHDEFVDAEVQNQRNQVQHSNDDAYTYRTHCPLPDFFQLRLDIKVICAIVYIFIYW